MKVTGTAELRKNLRRVGPAILPFIAGPVRQMADEISAAASLTVPRDDGELAQSQFVDGPQIDSAALRVGATVGYEAPHAPYAHESVHYGRKSSEPNKWLERAAEGRERSFRDDVAAAIDSGLQSLSK